jgi:hypothetical protein
MRSASIIAQRLRLASLLALGAFGVHQLRYLLAYGGDSGRALGEQGHDYLASALPVLAALGLAALLATALRVRLGPGLSQTSWSGRILFCSAALLAIYSGQELLEGVLAAGHPGGAAALVGAGGWIALPLTVAFGFLLALAMRLLEGIEVVLSRLASRPRAARPPRVRGAARGERRANPLSSPLAFGLARRPPPLGVQTGF